MNMVKLVVATALSCSLIACATSNYSIGKDFDSLNVQNIVKGETTTSELVSMFGQPYTKTVISVSDEKWIYMYSSGSASAKNYIVKMDVETTGYQKMLDVLVSDGVVANFAYTEGPIPYSVDIN